MPTASEEAAKRETHAKKEHLERTTPDALRPPQGPSIRDGPERFDNEATGDALQGL